MSFEQRYTTVDFIYSAHMNFREKDNQTSNPPNVHLVNDIHDTEEDTTILYSQSIL